MLEENVIDQATETDLVDIEEFAKRGEKPPPAKRYAFRIDKQRYEWPRRFITGLELLKLAKKDPARCSIRQKKQGQVKTIKPDETVDLGEPGIERFMTLCHDQQDG